MHRFNCPHNESVLIVERCPITECPYHNEQVSKLFTLEADKTGCVYHDTDIMANVSDSRTQISALSRDKRRQVSPKSIKTMYEDGLMNIRTLYELTHSISSSNHYCQKCGYPQQPTILKCVSPTVCASRLEWINLVVSRYTLEDVSVVLYSLIWELLLKDKIHLEESALDVGRNLCMQKDIIKYRQLQSD